VVVVVVQKSDMTDSWPTTLTCADSVAAAGSVDVAPAAALDCDVPHSVVVVNERLLRADGHYTEAVMVLADVVVVVLESEQSHL
jgi:hypothetical protein